MDLKKIRYFVSVAEAGSFTLASQELGLAQPALSQQVSALERELGIDLFYRTGRGVVLTDAGEELMVRARSILTEVERLGEEISSLRDMPQGTIVLGVPPSVSHSLVSAFVLEMRRRFPKVRLKVIEGSSGFIREWLAKGRLDIGILYRLETEHPPAGEVLLVEDLSLVGRIDDPVIAAGTVSFDRLAGLPLMLPGRPHGLRTLLDSIARNRQVELHAVLELDGAALVRSLVVSGCGYSILPDITVSLDLSDDGIACARIIDPVITRTMIISSTNEKRARTTTRMAIALLRELAGRMAGRDGACGSAEPSSLGEPVGQGR